MPEEHTPDHDSDVRPPNPPWMELHAPPPHCGYLSFYISDDLSALAVRAVTLPGNNKSDPNLETGTYGLFSTCERQMRAGVVNNGSPYLFFVTRYRGRRVLAGHYRIAWYCDGPLSSSGGDYALAADRLRFIHPPIPLDELPGGLREHATGPLCARTPSRPSSSKSCLRGDRTGPAHTSRRSTDLSGSIVIIPASAAGGAPNRLVGMPPAATFVPIHPGGGRPPNQSPTGRRPTCGTAAHAATRSTTGLY